jgi:hypothetical protein
MIAARPNSHTASKPRTWIDPPLETRNLRRTWEVS